MSDKKTLTVKLVRSVAGTREDHRATVRGLGLRKLNSTRTLEDKPLVRGMIEESAAAYAKEKGITPRDCSKEM